MKVPITRDYLDGLRARLIDAEDAGNNDRASALRDEYRTACAAAYSSGDLVFAPQPPAHDEVSLTDRIDAFERALWNSILSPLGATDATRRRLRSVVEMDMQGAYRAGRRDEREAAPTRDQESCP